MDYYRAWSESHITQHAVVFTYYFLILHAHPHHCIFHLFDMSGFQKFIISYYIAMKRSCKDVLKIAYEIWYEQDSVQKMYNIIIVGKIPVIHVLRFFNPD